jgi:ATP-dependent DNA helicase RecG
MDLDFDDLFSKLCQGDESVEIEAKESREIGPSLLETICAMSNEPGRGGGYLLLGVSCRDESLFPDYHITGVPNPDKFQADLASQCASVFNVSIRPQISRELKGDKVVLAVFIPEAQPHEKPVFIESKGLPRGAFRRIGSADVVCTDDDLQALYQGRDHHSFDEGMVKKCALEDLDASAINEYRRTRAEANPNAPELGYRDEELLRSLSCVDRIGEQLIPTIAGVLLFGKRATIRRVFPLMRLDYIRVSGREWVRDPDSRFDTVEILDPILLALPRAINAILDDIPKAFQLPAGALQRRDVPLIPQTAIREAMVNAVMHRSYRHKSPIQIIRYANRLEIRNPGHSLVPDDRLGEPGSITRNEKIAAVLHETRFAETKGSGIRAMREAMSKANLGPPTFESDREKDNFVVTFLFHHFLNEDDVRWLGQFAEHHLSEDEQKALVFAREMGAVNNSAYRDINQLETLVASGHLRRLRGLGLLEQRGKGSATYYTPTQRLLAGAPVPSQRGIGGHDLKTEVPAQPKGAAPAVTAQAQGLTPAITDLPTGAGANLQGLPTGLGANLQGLPTELADAVRGIGRRSAMPNLRILIARLCTWQPLTSDELAMLLRRNRHYILTTLLRPMIRDGTLEYLYPDNPAHPQQAYRVGNRGDGDHARNSGSNGTTLK